MYIFASTVFCVVFVPDEEINFDSWIVNWVLFWRVCSFFLTFYFYHLVKKGTLKCPNMIFLLCPNHVFSVKKKFFWNDPTIPCFIRFLQLIMNSTKTENVTLDMLSRAPQKTSKSKKICGEKPKYPWVTFFPIVLHSVSLTGHNFISICLIFFKL